jgi:hypothetical protein
VQFSVTRQRNRIPGKPAIPFQQRRWTLHDAPVSLDQQFHVCEMISGGLEGCVKRPSRRCSLSELETAGCDGCHMHQDSSGKVQGTRAAINWRITVALASLVRVASGFHLRPSGTSTTGVVPICRTEMDRRHHQRLGAAMDLSENKSWPLIHIGISAFPTAFLSFQLQAKNQGSNPADRLSLCPLRFSSLPMEGLAP